MIQWNPHEYNQNSAQLEKWAKELVGKLRLIGTEKLLDIGSGDGKVTAAISRLLPGGSVIGIDSSVEMIEFAIGNYPPKECPNLEFRLMDMRDLHFEEEFDLVFSTATLHWVTDHVTVLKQINKSLKSGGRMFLQMGGARNQKDLIEVLEAVKEERKWVPYFDEFSFQYGYYGINEYQKWLRETGFIEKRVEFLHKDNELNGKQGLCQWIRLAFSPYVQKLPQKLQPYFIEEIATRYLQINPISSEEICRIRMVRLEVEACKM